MGERRIFATGDALADTAAARIAAAAASAIAARGRFSLALSGGRTPQPLYLRLVTAEIDWMRVRIFFADERAVPPDDPESNFRLARETLLDAAHVPPRNVHRMKGEYADLAAAALEYEAHLTEACDVIVLGIGEDGHVASLFPHGAALGEITRRVAPVLDAPKPPPRRLTLTPRALAEAGDVLVLATGSGKAAAVAAALSSAGSTEETPARLVRDRVWLLDRAAAALLQ